jgi:CBS domain-containing protein
MENMLIEVIHEKGNVIHSVSPDTTIAEAVRKMNDNRIGAIVVMEGDRLVGIFTERDVLTRVAGQDLDPQATPVSQVMTSDVVTVKSTTTVEEAMRIVTELRFRHLPIMDEERLIGLVSSGDLTRWVVRDQEDTIHDLVNYIYDQKR